MKTKFIIAISLLIILSGCYQSKPHTQFDGEFVDSKSIKTIDLNMEQCQLDVAPLAPWSCCMLDSLLIIGENFNKMTTNFFKVYNQNKMVSEFGILGNGPDDFDAPFMNSKGKAEKQHFFINGFLKFIKITIDSNYRVQQQALPMPDEFGLFNKVLLYNDSAIVVNQTGDFQLRKIDKKTNKISDYNYFEDPGKFSKIQKINLTAQYYKSVCSSNKQYVVIAYNYLKMIDIISLSTMSLHKRICFENYDENECLIDESGNITFDEDNTKNYFTYITAAENCFYALCWDCKGEEASSGKILSSIFVIDYDGNIIKQYKPNVSITSFVINNNVIYAIVLDHIQHEKIICKGTLQ